MLISNALLVLSSWREAQESKSHVSIVNENDECIKWCKPSSGQFKCNFDAATNVALNMVGFGCLLRNSDGEMFQATNGLWKLLRILVSRGTQLQGSFELVEKLRYYGRMCRVGLSPCQGS